jgi:hypothetical protein
VQTKYKHDPNNSGWIHKFHRVARQVLYGPDDPVLLFGFRSKYLKTFPLDEIPRPSAESVPCGIFAWTFLSTDTYDTVSELANSVESHQKLVPEAAGTAALAVRAQRATLEPWLPQTLADRDAVLAQLELLLAHPLFSQSKRYPALLRFVVEQSLEGNADQLKERLIGMEVFSRSPGYDANADPIVRVTAGEIRKRLAQYYYDPSHSEEIRVELPTGSYVPVFQRQTPLADFSDVPVLSEVEPALEAIAGDDSLPAVAPVNLAGHQPIIHHHNAHPILTILLVFVTLMLGLAGGYWLRAYRVSRIPVPVSPDQTVDDFWQPLTAGPATVTFCLGEPARDSSNDKDPAQTIQHPKLAEPLYFRLRQSGLFALADVATLTRMSSVLERQHKAFRIAAASEASFSQLREGPAVVIGAFDNLWTMRLTRDLRFGFDSVNGNAFIVDRKSLTKTTWITAWDLPYERLVRDYAIVARYRDSLTGQPVVIAAGISEEGTEAAGELISNPADLDTLLRVAPANWRTTNMEAVIETEVIDGHAGPPKLRAVEFW